MHLRRSKSLNNSDLILIDLEIERTCRANRAHRRQEMAEVRANRDGNELQVQVGPQPTRLRDIQRPHITSNPSCIRLSAAARNYEFRNIHLNSLPQFHGLGSEDALEFIREFFYAIETLPLNGISEEELKMRCYPYSKVTPLTRRFSGVVGRNL